MSAEVPVKLGRMSIAVRLGMFTLLLGLGLYALYRLDFDVAALFRHSQNVPAWGFVLAMSVLPVVGFPIAAFYLFAGFAFDFWNGWAYCLIGLAVNMSLSYLVARHLLKGPLTVFLNARGYTLPKLSEVNQFRFVFLLRTIPGPPFPLQNYLLSLIGIPFGLYLSVSLLTQGAIAGGMVAFGGMLPEELTLAHLWVGLAILSILVLGKLFLWLRARRRERK